MIHPGEGAKILLSYNVIPEYIDSYFRYFVGRYIPVMQAMGLEVSEAWQTAYGDAPDRLIGFISPDKETVMELVEGEEWDELNEELRKYVTDFSCKVIKYQEGFQI